MFETDKYCAIFIWGIHLAWISNCNLYLSKMQYHYQPLSSIKVMVCALFLVLFGDPYSCFCLYICIVCASVRVYEYIKINNLYELLLVTLVAAAATGAVSFPLVV